MKEKDFQIKLNTWLKYNWNETAAFELKLTKTKSLSFSALAPHQENALLLVKHKKLIFKIPDAGFLNPFDGFCLANASAFVVIMFYVRGCKNFYMIDIDSWIRERENSPRKSLTEERVREIGTTYKLA